MVASAPTTLLLRLGNLSNEQPHIEHSTAVKVFISIGTGQGFKETADTNEDELRCIMYSQYETMKALASDTEIVHGPNAEHHSWITDIIIVSKSRKRLAVMTSHSMHVRVLGVRGTKRSL